MPTSHVLPPVVSITLVVLHASLTEFHKLIEPRVEFSASTVSHPHFPTSNFFTPFVLLRFSISIFYVKIQFSVDVADVVDAPGSLTIYGNRKFLH